MLCNHNLISLWRECENGKRRNANGKKETIKFQHLLAIHMTLTTYVVQTIYLWASMRVRCHWIHSTSFHAEAYIEIRDAKKTPMGRRWLAATVAVQRFANEHRPLMAYTHTHIEIPSAANITRSLSSVSFCGKVAAEQLTERRSLFRRMSVCGNGNGWEKVRNW